MTLRDTEFGDRSNQVGIGITHTFRAEDHPANTDQSERDAHERRVDKRFRQIVGFQIGQIVFSPEAMLNLVAVEVIGPSQTNVMAETLLKSLPAELGINNESTLGKALSSAAAQGDIQRAFILFSR